MNIQDYFDESLVSFLDIDNQDEALKYMATVVRDQSLVEDSFTQAILNREVEYPTGLSSEHIHIALPHTDSHHVIKPFISIGVLKKRIPFKLMGEKDTEIKVEIIFMLGIKNASEQLEVLQTLMEIIQDKEVSQQLKNGKKKEEIISTVQNFTKKIL